MNIKASNELSRAPTTEEEYLRRGVRCIDGQFGAGFAKEHPELLAAYLGSALIVRALEEIANAIEEVTIVLDSRLNSFTTRGWEKEPL